MRRLAKIVYLAGVGYTAFVVSDPKGLDNDHPVEDILTTVGIALAWPLVAVLAVADMAFDEKRPAV